MVWGWGDGGRDADGGGRWVGPLCMKGRKTEREREKEHLALR